MEVEREVWSKRCSLLSDIQERPGAEVGRSGGAAFSMGSSWRRFLGSGQ
jgi:hypothetical protein